MNISPRGIALIKRFESLRLQAYDDANGKPLKLGDTPIGIPTVGYGHIKNVKPGDYISPATADQMLREDVAEFEAGVGRLVTRPLKQSQFDALVSFAFNVGLDEDADTKAEGLGDSTLLALVNAGRDQDAAAEFLRWNRAGGRALLGLMRRRIAEAALYVEDL